MPQVRNTLHYEIKTFFKCKIAKFDTRKANGLIAVHDEDSAVNLDHLKKKRSFDRYTPGKCTSDSQPGCRGTRCKRRRPGHTLQTRHEKGAGKRRRGEEIKKLVFFF